MYHTDVTFRDLTTQLIRNVLSIFFRQEGKKLDSLCESAKVFVCLNDLTFSIFIAPGLEKNKTVFMYSDGFYHPGIHIDTYWQFVSLPWMIDIVKETRKWIWDGTYLQSTINFYSKLFFNKQSI